jgi:hypothetical protein
VELFAEASSDEGTGGGADEPADAPA